MKYQFNKGIMLAALGILIALASMGTAWAQSGAPSIQGKIKDGYTDGLLQGAVVVLEGTPYRARSGSDGAYRLDEIPDGTYTLTVSYVGFDEFQTDVTVSASETVRLPIVLTRAVMVTEQVIVQGYRFGESKSLNDQKEAANIKNIVAEEQIDAFPDVNTAEVLQRVSGITIQRDNGEGRFVAMRGTPSAYTNVTINGQQVAYSNTENRTVELDVISASQLAGIEVTKVLTPNMDADAVGGSIDLKTRSAFDYQDRLLTATASLGSNSIADGTHTRLDFDYADIFGANDNIGFSIGLNYRRTVVERHNNEQKWDSEDDINGNEIPFALTNSEVQFSENVRDRYGLNSQLEYRFNENHKLTFAAVYNYREDDQDRQITRIRWDKGDYITPTEVQDLRIVKSLHDRIEEQEISSFTLAGEHFFGASMLEFSLSTSKASTEKPKGQLKPEFEWRGVDLDVIGITTKAPNWDTTDPNLDIHEGNNYALDKVDVKYEDTSSTINAGTLDFETPMVWGSDTGMLQIGGKLRSLDKERADLREVWKWEGDDDLTLAQFETDGIKLLESGYNLGNSYDRAAFRRFFFGNQTDNMFELDESRIDVNLGEPYDAKEDISSVYVMTTQEYGDLMVLGGFRYEKTKLDYQATFLVTDDGDFVGSELVESKRNYNELFPNLQFRYRLTPDSNIRLAYSKSMARPDFWAAMPYQFVDTDGEEISRGNPDLDPAISNNFDFLAEYFFSGVGVLSGGVFYKQLDDFNYQAQFDEVGGEFDGYEVEQVLNGGGADLLGIELTWQQQFTQLPGFWSGFGIYANYTYTDAKNIDLASTGDRTEIDVLPEQVEDVWNLALIYERNNVVSRLSANHTGKWIEEVGSNEDEDDWRDETTTIDFSFKWMFENGLDLFFQANNLTDEVKYVYYGVPTRSSQYSITGRTFNVGASFTF